MTYFSKLDAVYKSLVNNPYYIILFIAVAYSALSFYSVLYGAMFIQIAKLLVNEMGLSIIYALPLTRSLIMTALIPEAVNWITNIYQEIICVFDPPALILENTTVFKFITVNNGLFCVPDILPY